MKLGFVEFVDHLVSFGVICSDSAALSYCNTASIFSFPTAARKLLFDFAFDMEDVKPLVLEGAFATRPRAPRAIPYEYIFETSLYFSQISNAFGGRFCIFGIGVFKLTGVTYAFSSSRTVKVYIVRTWKYHQVVTLGLCTNLCKVYQYTCCKMQDSRYEIRDMIMKYWQLLSI
jgi:hypothetical protein